MIFTIRNSQFGIFVVVAKIFLWHLKNSVINIHQSLGLHLWCTLIHKELLCCLEGYLARTVVGGHFAAKQDMCMEHNITTLVLNGLRVGVAQDNLQTFPREIFILFHIGFVIGSYLLVFVC